MARLEADAELDKRCFSVLDSDAIKQADPIWGVGVHKTSQAAMSGEISANLAENVAGHQGEYGRRFEIGAALEA